jgi:Na+/proline symporter
MLGIGVLPAILLFVALSLSYTYIGGIKAVVWTDAAQFVLLLAGGVFVLFYVPTFFDDGIGGVWREARLAGKLEWFNPRFGIDMPYNIWMGLIGATVVAMSSHGADQLIVQRVLSCRSVSAGRKSLLLSAAIILPLFLVFLLAGAFIWVYAEQIGLGMELPRTEADAPFKDYVFPVFILADMPGVVKGLLIVGVLSAAMSSVSSALSALASVSTMDFIKGLARTPRSEEYYLKLSRRSTVFWGLALVVVAFLTQNVDSVLKAAFSLSGLTSGAMLGGVLLSIMWKRGSSTPVIAGMIASFFVWRREYTDSIQSPGVGTVMPMPLSSQM